jgi:hypothetical protein
MTISQAAKHLIAHRSLIGVDIFFYPPDNEQPTYIHHKLMPDARMAERLEEAFQDYKLDELYIQVHRPNGSSTKKETPIMIQRTTSTPPSSANFSTPPASGFSDMQLYLLQQKDQQLSDLREQVNTLKNALRSSENEIKGLEKVKAKLEHDVAFKDREFELREHKRDVEIERERYQSENQGLNGIITTFGGPEVVMDLVKTAMMAKMQPVQQLPAQDDDFSQLPGNKLAYAKAFAKFLTISDDLTAAKVYNLLAYLTHNKEQIDHLIQEYQIKIQ